MVASTWSLQRRALLPRLRGFLALCMALSVLLALVVWQAQSPYNFRAIRDGRVYASGVIPPGELGAYVQRYRIRTIIDLRDPSTGDKTNNPEQADAIARERAVVSGLGGVRHVHLPTDQVPTPATVRRFLAIMDAPATYPVLIHCHHGVGRAALFSALYRIEYEGMSNADARAATRWFPAFSSFAEARPKGAFLLHYRPRAVIARSTAAGSAGADAPPPLQAAVTLH